MAGNKPVITDVRTESPFWLIKNGYLKDYHSLTEDLKADFVVVGGGISGALTARSLVIAGASVILLDRRHIGMGSTSASTALLQYDIDQPLINLMEIIGDKAAIQAYKLSLKALTDLDAIASTLSISNNFEPRLSIRFAKYKKDVSVLEKEFNARRSAGFDVELWDATRVEKNFSFTAPVALATRPSAIVDPYRLTHGLLVDAVARGLRIYDKTQVRRIERLRNSVVLHTNGGRCIKSKKIVIACGYESVNYLPKKIGILKSTFALATEPLPQSKIWHENCIFWDTNDPYNYGRTTADNRVIFGGEDEPFYDPKKRDSLLEAKTRKLSQKLAKLFPSLAVTVDYSWAGTFIETEDGLPYIGSIKQLPHTYFALGYGGNGITFSQLAADILTDQLTGKTNNHADLFSFNRKFD